MERGDTNTIVLDLRDIDPVEHHDRLFGAVRSLAEGEHLKLITHYNPERYLDDLRATYAGQLSWEEQASEPPDWSVIMTRVPPGSAELPSYSAQPGTTIAPAGNNPEAI